MKRLIGFILSLFLIITSGSARADEKDKYSETFNIDIKKSVYTKYGGTADLNFITRDGTVFADGQELLENLGFKVEINDGELWFRNYQINDGDDMRIGPFCNRDIAGTFSTKDDSFYFTYIFPGVEKFKAPAKSIFVGDRIYIPFNFALEVLNLKLDSDAKTIKSTDLSKLDVMLDSYDYMKNGYIFGQNYYYGLGWKGIYKGSDSKFNQYHNFLIGYLNNYFDGKHLENLMFEKESINKLTDRMLTYKSLNAINGASRIIKGATKTNDNIKDSIDFAKIYYFIELPKKDFPDFISTIGDGIDAFNSVLKVYAKTDDLLKQTSPYTAKTIKEYFASTYNSDIKNSFYTDFMKDFEKNIEDRTKVATDKVSLYKINGADKLIDKSIGLSKKLGQDGIQELSLNALIKEAEGKNLGKVDVKDFKNFFKLQKLGLKLGHKAIKKMFKKDISASESYTISQFSILLSKMVSHDFYRAYLKLGTNKNYDDRYTDEGFKYLNQSMYMSLLSTFTSMDLMDDHLSVFKDMKNRKAYFSSQKARITELMAFFELAKDEDISEVIFNKKRNEDFLKGKESTKTVEVKTKRSASKNILKEDEEQENQDKNEDVEVDKSKVTNVIAEFTSETQGDSTYEVMVLKGVNPDGDIMWTKSVKSIPSQMTTLKLLAINKDYFYYASSDGVFKASMTDGSTIWVNSDGAAVVDSALGKDGRLYLTMGIAYKFQVIDKDGKTLKLIKDFDEVLPMREYGFYELGKVKLINDKLYIELFMGDSVPNEKERYMEMNVSDYSLTLPDFGIYTTYSELGNDGHEAYHDIINNESPDDYVYCEYGYVDIDDDGSDELVIHKGENEVSRTYTFYTLVGGKPVKLGEVEAWHSAVYKNGNRLIKANGEGDYGDFVIISYNKRQKVITTSKQNKYARGTAEFYFGEPIRYRKIE